MAAKPAGQSAMSRKRKQKTPETPPKPHDPQFRTALVVCGLLLLAVCLVFGRTIDYGFVDYDDEMNICSNPQILHGLSGKGIDWAFTTNHGGQWAPVTWTSYLADYELHGLKPSGYHFTNVALHAATTILLFIVLWQMTGRLWPCAFVAAVFAVHPLHVESVAWIAERKGLLSGLFFVLSLGAYLHYVRRPSLLRYSILAVFFALGLMSKPTLVTLPFILLLLDYWPLGRMSPNVAGTLRVPSARSEPPRFAVWHLIVEKIPLLLLTVASCAIAPWAQGNAVVALQTVSLSARIGNALVSCVAYLGETFWPAYLAVFYPHPCETLPAWKPAVALLVLLAITSAVLARWRRNPYLVVGWLWYLGMLVPVIGLVQIGSHAMADRYMYLPQIGLCIAVTWGTLHVAQSWPHRTWVCAASATTVVMALTACAWQQTTHWRSNEALWTHAIACTSDNDLAHGNLGIELAKQQRYDEAIAQYRAALKIKPNDAKTYSCLGDALLHLGQIDGAIEQYDKSLRINHDSAETHCHLGVALARQKRLPEAVAEYEAALKIDQNYVDAHCNLGNALARQGRLDDAITHYNKALDIQPNRTEIRQNLNHVLSLKARSRAK